MSGILLTQAGECPLPVAPGPEAHSYLHSRGLHRVGVHLLSPKQSKVGWTSLGEWRAESRGRLDRASSTLSVPQAGGVHCLPATHPRILSRQEVLSRAPAVCQALCWPCYEHQHLILAVVQPILQMGKLTTKEIY